MDNKTKKINVLLATYNGEKYLSQQLDSLLINFKLIPDHVCQIIISDDASQDSTLMIINDYIAKNDCITLINKARKGGVKQNFEYLIKQVSPDVDYLFFCDQDDFWLPSKIKTFINAFLSIEEGNHPVLIHSDLVVTNEELLPQSASLFAMQKLKKRPGLHNLLVQNSVTGCASAINRPLLQLLKTCNYTHSIMHDWYIALLASIMGKVVYVPFPTMLYRQHGGNVIGAKKFTLYHLFYHFRDTLNKIKNAKKSILDTKNQCVSLLGETSMNIPAKQKKIMRHYINSFESDWMTRFVLFFRGFRKHTHIRNVFFFIVYVFFIKK